MMTSDVVRCSQSAVASGGWFRSIAFKSPTSDEKLRASQSSCNEALVPSFENQLLVEASFFDFFAAATNLLLPDVVSECPDRSDTIMASSA